MHFYHRIRAPAAISVGEKASVFSAPRRSVLALARLLTVIPAEVNFLPDVQNLFSLMRSVHQHTEFFIYLCLAWDMGQNVALHAGTYTIRVEGYIKVTDLG